MEYKKLFGYRHNQNNVQEQNTKASKNLANQKAQTQQILYSIAHAIPGRIRFRIPRVSKDAEYAKKLKLAIESKIKNAQVRINSTASSVVINYPTDLMSEKQMRSHLVNLIQTAPNIALPKKSSVKTIAGNIFDALINLMESLRKFNKARNAIQHRQPKKDSWERLLSFGESIIKGFKSAIVFVLPHKRWQSQSALHSA